MASPIHFVPTHGPKEGVRSIDSIQNLSSAAKTSNGVNEPIRKQQHKIKAGESLNKPCSLSKLSQEKSIINNESEYFTQGEKVESVQKVSTFSCTGRSPTCQEIKKPPLKVYGNTKRDNSDSDFEPKPSKNKILATNHISTDRIITRRKMRIKHLDSMLPGHCDNPIDLCDDDDDDDDMESSSQEIDILSPVKDPVSPSNKPPIRNLIEVNSKSTGIVEFPFLSPPAFGFLPPPIHSPIIFFGKKKFYSKGEKCTLQLSPHNKYLKILLEDENLEDLDLIKKRRLDYEKISFSDIDKIM